MHYHYAKPPKTTIVSSLLHYVHHLTGGVTPVVQEPLGWERLGKTYCHRISGFTRHGGRQRREILGNRSSVRQRSARSLPPRRRNHTVYVINLWRVVHLQTQVVRMTVAKIWCDVLSLLGPVDNVRCYWCGGSLKAWQPTDQPVAEHFRWFPDCKLSQDEQLQIPLQSSVSISCIVLLYLGVPWLFFVMSCSLLVLL